MKYSHYRFAVCCLLVLTVACTRDEEFTEPQNRIPGEFTLLTVEDQAEDVDLNPIFSWEQATDPDGDPVTYSFFLSTENEEPTAELASGLTQTIFTPEISLNLTRKYNWKVVADDGMGGKITSPVFTFTTRHGQPKLVTRQMSLRSRGSAALVVYKGIMVIIGGFIFENDKVDHRSGVYGSEDGMSWEYIAEDYFGGRSGHTAVVFKDQIWMIGGRDQFGALGEVWVYGESNWDRVTKNLIPRFGHKSIVYDDKIWIIGGFAPKEGHMNDVWYSSDGVNWTQATDHAAFSPRSLHGAVVYEDKMWVFGGQDGNGFVKPGAWVSTDGETWTLAENVVLDDGVSHHASVVFRDQIWVIAGKNTTRVNLTYDLHWNGSFNGHSYGDFGNHTRYDPATVVFDDKIWIVGGWNNEGSFRDVWNIE